jgi:hypothetical protein
VEREKKRRIAVFYELHKREIEGDRAAVLGWYLASIKIIHLLLNSSSLVKPTS